MNFKKDDKVEVTINDTIYDGTMIGNKYRFIVEDEIYADVYIYKLGDTLPVKIKNIKKI